MSAETLDAGVQVFNLPDLGEGLTEAELVNWLVAEGDTVVVDQAIAEVETAKSVVEVPSPFAGVVVQLHGAAGTTMDVGKPLISVRKSGSAAETYREEERAGISAPADVPVVRAAGEGTAAGVETEGSGNVLIGYGTPGGMTGGRRRRSKKAAQAPQPGAESPTAETAILCSSPLVRKLARNAGISLSGVQGTGPNGMILRRDVEGAIAGSGSEPSAAQVSSDVQDRKSGLAISSRTHIKGVRKTVADNMSRSRREIPEATVWVDVDATALLDMRAALKKQQPESTPGLLAFIARFVLAGLAKYPDLNTRVVSREDGNQEILGFVGVNLGIAAQTDRGLMVPCVQRADLLSARGLDAEIRRLTAVVRDGKATPVELTSGTFTLNNYGVFGVDGSAAIINHPEAAILGVGRIIDRPWVVDGELAVRKVTELTLAFDHRVCDGGVAGGFLRYVADAMENPGSLLADL
ncbi:dihydrolipoamide acetyltransferase family protein [Arthrobacter sp. H5]|uniref:dihydrolipoamide acetyltransferase family protein n=1 Tax=Arthrobacter sp. H5 TaxID=1267973 RepID=UPI0004879C8E|nr:dihydrolipoamide acetyltransferase family protein [Arthrobacter sp. H5]